MSDELIQKAHEYIISDRPLRSFEETLVDFAAECVRAERERADRLKRECDNIYERLSWILSACTIDRDAKNEIEELLK